MSTTARRPVLHDYWRSSAAYRVRIALALKGIAFDRVTVDLAANDQRSPAHLALHPQGRVPVLRIDGLVLMQSLAMIAYLDETRPTPPLLPSDPAGRARVRAIAMTVACDIHPISNLGTLRRVEALAGSEARAIWNRTNIAEGLATIETLLDHPATGRFCHGDTPGLAECCLIPQLYNATRWGVDLSAMPRLSAIGARATALPAFASAHPDAVAPSA